jgi:hypothetical protein
MRIDGGKTVRAGNRRFKNGCDVTNGNRVAMDGSLCSDGFPRASIRKFNKHRERITHMKTGNGKIANLPSQIRDELNRRIDDGVPGNELVEWLNSQPEVLKVITERFDGCPISEQNLSEWRKRGHQQWLADRMIIDELGGLSENADAIGQTGISGEKLLLVLTAAYAVMIQNWEIIPKDELTYKMAVFRHLTNGVLAVRRGELQAIRVEIAHERLEMIQEKRRQIAASSSAKERALASSRVRPGASEAHRSESTAFRSGEQAVPLATASQSSARSSSLSRHPENASDYFDSLGLSPWSQASLPGSRVSPLPLDEFLDGLGSLIPLKVLSLSKWPKQPDGTRSKPLCAQIQPEKLAA